MKLNTLQRLASCIGLLTLCAALPGCGKGREKEPVEEKYPGNINPPIGQPVSLEFHSFTGDDKPGPLVSLSSLKGKVVLIDFWATWCPPCIAEMPAILATYKKLHSKGFEVLGVSLDDEKDALSKFLKEHDMPWPQYFNPKGVDNEVATQFGVTIVPALLLVDKQGKLVSVSMSAAKLEAEVAELLAK